MRPVDKGARTPDQYLGQTARNAYAHAGGLAGAGPIVPWLLTQNARKDDYRDAKEHLAATIGEYCSFCERRIPAKLDVEHRAPKDVYPPQKFEWGNFLLACGNCNSVKGTKHKVVMLEGGGVWEETTEATYCFWPDVLAPLRNQPYGQDSYNVFRYGELGIVALNPNIPDGPTRDRVLATMALTGIDRVLDTGTQRVPHLAFRTNKNDSGAETWENLDVSGQAPSAFLMHPHVAHAVPPLRFLVPRDRSTLQGRYAQAALGQIESKDYRSLHRSEAWDKAEECRVLFDKLFVGSPLNWGDREHQGISYQEFKARFRDHAKQVIDLALSTGFWSVWVTVFKARPPNARFLRRPAIVPVIRALIRRFPGTRPNTDFSPPLYSPADEAAFAQEIQRKVAQQQHQDAHRHAQEAAHLALEDDVQLLQQRVYNLRDDNEALRDDLDVEGRRAERYRRERNEALDTADRLRDDRQYEYDRRRRAERDLYHEQRDNDRLRRERNAAEDEVDRLRAQLRMYQGHQ